MVKPKHAGGRARRQQLIMRRLSGEFDDRTCHGTDEGERDGSGRRADRDRPHSPPRVNEACAALDERFGNPLELTPLLQDEVAVAIAREAPRGRLEQSATRARASVRLRWAVARLGR